MHERPSSAEKEKPQHDTSGTLFCDELNGSAKGVLLIQIKPVASSADKFHCKITMKLQKYKKL
jgi:hypothetical protein